MPVSTSQPTASTEDLSNRANFIFRGTVLRVNASTVPSVPASASTALVKVDEVLSAPNSLVGYAGQTITVQLADNEQVTVGEQATFYANGLVFGESLAVQSVGHHDIAVASAALATAAGDPVQTWANLHLQQHLASTPTVVTGTVTATRLPDTAASPTQSYVSEHDPEWHDAIVNVTGVERGSLAQKSITVRYPNSQDVRWYQVPKLRPGMSGVFLLHPQQEMTTNAAPGAAAVTPDASAFVLLHPEDFQPIDQLPRVRALVQ